MADITLASALNQAAPRRVALALFLLFALLYLAPIGVRPLASPDEVRYGEISREMLASGDWVAPRFIGVRYFEKPVLGYWLNSVSLAALGENAYALRLPVALATGLTALIVFLLTRRFVTNFSAALATSIFLTTLLVGGVGTFGVLDAFLALCLTAALAAYYVALTETCAARRVAYLVLCGAACGAAFLVKGFIAWAIPVIVAFPYLAARRHRQWRVLLTTPWAPLVTALAVAIPWAVLVHLREPDFWHYFFWVEHVQRFAGASAQHARPPWFYVAYLPGTGWPWILFLPAALLGLRADGRDKAFLWYVAAWALLPLLFFSLSRGKVQTYVLPCFAPLSILLAAGLERYFAAGGRRAFRVGVAAIAGVFVLILVLVVAAQAGAFDGAVYSAEETPKLVALVAFVIGGAACAVVAYRSPRPCVRLAAIAGAGAALLLPLQVVVPQRVVETVAPATAIARYAAASPETVIVADARMSGAAAWALKRNDIYVLYPEEIGYGMSYPEGRHRKLEGPMLEELIAANRGRHEVLVICNRATRDGIAPHLPSDVEASEHGAVVLLRIAP
jgi:4-amino-4-deoxy-L-arabinose transferase